MRRGPAASPSRRLVLAGASLALAAPALAQTAVVGPADMSLGSARARVKVVEFASLSCPHCAAFHAEVFPAFKKKYVDTGRVQYTLKEVLTPPGEVAAAGFLLARCAGKARYFEVVADVFASQDEWATIGPRDSLLKIAQKHRLSEAQFEACIGDDAALKALNARIGKDADAAEIGATPTFFVNGKKVKEGAMTLAELDAAIAAAR
jgi:protein-disulfide isomerase